MGTIGGLGATDGELGLRALAVCSVLGVRLRLSFLRNGGRAPVLVVGWLPSALLYRGSWFVHFHHLFQIVHAGHHPVRVGSQTRPPTAIVHRIPDCSVDLGRLKKATLLNAP